MLDYHLIESTEDLEMAGNKLLDYSTFYIDTEFHYTAGSEKLCLVQISTGDQIYLIDSLKINNTKLLKDALIKPDCKWILHSASNDIVLLKNYLKASVIPSIFDTQLAWALLGPERFVSLSYLIYNILNERVQKSFQADNWTVRPFQTEQLEYAAYDVYYLPELEKKLLLKLKKYGKESLLTDINSELTYNALQRHDTAKKISINDFRNAWELDIDGLNALNFLIDWVNGGVDINKPEKLKNKTILNIAKMLPQSSEELSRIKGIPFNWIKKYGDLLTGRMIMATYNNPKNIELMEPEPYSTFAIKKIEGFLRMASVNICSEVNICPEIAFPTSLINDMADEIHSSKTIISASKFLKGWREKWLLKKYESFCKKNILELDD
tara:strand:+ start:1412 stop:2554 length:1143 start_codon:yes stop_codon:yes gene_type:complete